MVVAVMVVAGVLGSWLVVTAMGLCVCMLLGFE